MAKVKFMYLKRYINTCEWNYNNPNTWTAAALNNRKNIIKNCATNNTQIDNAKNIDAVMSIYNLIESCNNYSKTSENLRQYNRNKPALDANGAIIDFPAANNNSASFIFKQKIAGRIGNHGKKRC